MSAVKWKSCRNLVWEKGLLRLRAGDFGGEEGEARRGRHISIGSGISIHPSILEPLKGHPGLSCGFAKAGVT